MTDFLIARRTPRGHNEPKDMSINIELQSWQTPNFVIAVMPARPRQEGFNPDACPKWALKEVDAEVLARMCDDFRVEIFRKAEKPDPAANP